MEGLTSMPVQNQKKTVAFTFKDEDLWKANLLTEVFGYSLRFILKEAVKEYLDQFNWQGVVTQANKKRKLRRVQ